MFERLKWDFFKRRYKYFHQLDYMDCGPTCLKMIAAFYGREYSLEFLRTNSYITQNGVSLLGLSEASEKIGFRSLVTKISFKQLIEEAPLPCILHWNQEHYVVLFDIQDKNMIRKEKTFILGDPNHDLVKVKEDFFLKSWISTDESSGIALLLEPTPDFYQSEHKNVQKADGFRFLLDYIRPHKRYFIQVILGMLLGSLIGMCFPFLTQSLVDFGINRNNVNFIHLILLSQLVLFLGGIAIDLIRNWILLHVSTRISVSIISNFLIKIMKLPIGFFESKNIGDLTQRINDHHRIESFLTGSTLNTVFSIVNLFIYSFVLSLYSISLLAIFLIGSIMSILWVCIFLKRRKHIDYNRFQRSRENQNSLFEIITGMQEIKLYNCQSERRWEWERIQAQLFRVNVQSMALEQYQEVGASFFTQLKNIIISYSAAMLVVNQEITLGVMLSISFIIGQMNSPLLQLISFFRNVQDAKLSMERLSEIHNKNEEGEVEKLPLTNFNSSNEDTDFIQSDLINVNRKKTEKGIAISNLSFRYGAPSGSYVLKDINLFIPEGRITAIVGSSGSGKTTLLKLLLKFYQPTGGIIKVNGVDLLNISANVWREKCGTVMQDGFIFNDSIAKNISLEGENIDKGKLENSIQLANLSDYISNLPLGYTTKISNTGSCLSGGQKQRLFIARAIYKDPKYLFFDEATSALDSNNEKVIMENLTKFYRGKTVIIIAHRLSTVKNADQIVVMKGGSIVEQGNHQELASLQGHYFELVKNQLELGVS